MQISLAAARVNANKTQRDVAEKMHVSVNTVVNWEKGKTSPTVAQAKELADFYEMPISYIFFPEASN